jgi:hypothetical protein
VAISIPRQLLHFQGQKPFSHGQHDRIVTQNDKPHKNFSQMLTGQGGKKALFAHDGLGSFFLHYCSLCGIIILYSFSFLPSRNGKVAACRLSKSPHGHILKGKRSAPDFSLDKHPGHSLQYNKSMEEVVMLLMVVGDAVSSFFIHLCGLCRILRF